jgi:hypothetical protein
MSILKSNNGSNLEKLGCMCCLLFLIEKSQFPLAVVIRYLHPPLFCTLFELVQPVLIIWIEELLVAVCDPMLCMYLVA